MPGFVALLRAVNLGAKRKVPMADLRALAAGLGLRDARTYIASGNLVFGAERAVDAGTRLEAALEARFGFPVDVMVRSAAQWAKLVAANPFPGPGAAEPNRVLVLVPKGAPREREVLSLEARGAAGERLAIAGGAVWAHYPEGVGRSKIALATIERAIGGPATARNFATVRALDALVNPPPRQDPA
jgi:uncharacterized protein (DUF1697 family)